MLLLLSLFSVILITTGLSFNEDYYGEDTHQCVTNAECGHLKICTYAFGLGMRCFCKGGYVTNSRDECVTDPNWCEGAKDCEFGKKCYVIEIMDVPVEWRMCQSESEAGWGDKIVEGETEVLAQFQTKPDISGRLTVNGDEDYTDQCATNADCGHLKICTYAFGLGMRCFCKGGYVTNSRDECVTDPNWCEGAKDCEFGKKCYVEYIPDIAEIRKCLSESEAGPGYILVEGETDNCQNFETCGCAKGQRCYEYVATCGSSVQRKCMTDKPQNTCNGIYKIVHETFDAICQLPPDVGPCKAMTTRYFFNPTSSQCQQFSYGGCGGNKNNFKTLSRCQKKCNAPMSN